MMVIRDDSCGWGVQVLAFASGNFRMRAFRMEAAAPFGCMSSWCKSAEYF